MPEDEKEKCIINNQNMEEERRREKMISLGVLPMPGPSLNRPQPEAKGSCPLSHRPDADGCLLGLKMKRREAAFWWEIREPGKVLG